MEWDLGMFGLQLFFLHLSALKALKIANIYNKLF